MLVVLGERLTEPKIRELKEQHAEELTRLREEHEKILARALDRERRNSLKSVEDADIRKERFVKYIHIQTLFFHKFM